MKPPNKLRPKQNEYGCTVRMFFDGQLHLVELWKATGMDRFLSFPPFHHLPCLSASLCGNMHGSTLQLCATSTPRAAAAGLDGAAAADIEQGQGTYTYLPFQHLSLV